MVIWVVGISGAGKTTLARALVERWRAVDHATVLVDGDDVRRIVGADRAPSDYTRAARRANADRIHEICGWLDGQGINVVCAVLLLFDEVSVANRERYSGYHEVLIDAPLAEVEARDAKGLYAAARAGEVDDVVGIDLAWTPPSAPDRRVDNRGEPPDWDRLAASILAEVGVAVEVTR